MVSVMQARRGSLIGLAGKAGSGKDALAAHLVERYGFTRYAFADAVREAAESISELIWIKESGVTLKWFLDNGRDWDWMKRELPSARKALQLIGTELGREVLGANAWVDIVARKWLNDGKPNAVITDCRFPNEVKFIKGQGGEIWLIDRPNNPVGLTTTHASEMFNMRPHASRVIRNDGTLADLYAKVAE